MNSELIDAWEKIVGHDRIKIISNKFFDSIRWSLENLDNEKKMLE